MRGVQLSSAVFIVCSVASAAQAQTYLCTFRENANTVGTCKLETGKLKPPCMYTFDKTNNLGVLCTAAPDISLYSCAFTDNKFLASGQTHSGSAGFGAQYRAAPTATNYTVYCE
jgi:hypothetical protein